MQKMKFPNVLIIFYIVIYGYLIEHKFAKAASDDEDFSKIRVKEVQGSGNGDVEPPDMYPQFNPFVRTRYSATLLIDIAIAHEYKHYMLPTSQPSENLRKLHQKIINNIKYELSSIKVTCIITILSLRPGPLIKSISSRTPLNSVYARVNITQLNLSIVHPLITVHLSQCSHRGVLGNFTISDKLIFPLYVCQPNEVYCLPTCHTGTYCDGISDCSIPSFDEAESCPACLYKEVRVSTNRKAIHEDDPIKLICHFNTKCFQFGSQIEWNLPETLKRWEGFYKGKSLIESLPQSQMVSGSYGCSIDGEMSDLNITVFKKPNITMTRASDNAETVLISELDGSDLKLWCNTTSGEVNWHSMPGHNPLTSIHISDVDNQHSLLQIDRLYSNSELQLQCEVLWGLNNQRRIKKNVKVMIMCDENRQFQCKTPQTKLGGDGPLHQCIPLDQKCDFKSQCHDGSDENGCNRCVDNMIEVIPSNRIVQNMGSNIILTCKTKMSVCRPLHWYKDGKLIQSSSKVMIYRQSVYLLNVTDIHSGSYECADGQNTVKQKVEIDIVTAPKIFFIPNRKILNITIGEKKTIDCFVAHTSIKYHKEPVWRKKNSFKLPSGVTNNSYDQSLSQLNFNNADRDMSGRYQCEVIWGGFLSKSNSNNFEPQLKPKLSIKYIDVLIVPVVCKSNEKLCTDGKKCVLATQWCDNVQHCNDKSDELQCEKCKNGFIFVEPSQVVLMPSLSVDLHCYYHRDCNPIQWRFIPANSANKPVEITSLAHYGSKSNLQDRSRLKLDNVTNGTVAGKYECYSGKKSAKANVKFVNNIIIEIAENEVANFVKFHQRVEIVCRSNYGTPEWRKRDFTPISKLYTGRVVQVDQHITKLVFDTPQYDARGYYICFIRLPQSNEDVVKKLMYLHVYNLSCHDDEFICDNNTKCVKKTQKCDRIVDCQDKSDEKNCSKCSDDLYIIPNNLKLTSGGWGSLECHVPHNDCLPVKWDTGSNAVTTQDEFTFVSHKTSLYIIKPSIAQGGIIKCYSVKQPNKIATAFLTVQDLQLNLIPQQIPNSVLYVKTSNTPVEIICHSNVGEPRWAYPSRGTVEQYGVNYIRINKTTEILRLINAQNMASNTYICTVTFTEETKKVSVTIKVI